MERNWAMVEETAVFIQERTELEPVVGILTGTGLGGSAASLSIENNFDYRHIPNFPLPTVVSHAGRLLTGEIAGRHAMVFQGRFHLYEGYTPFDVAYPVRVMQLMGIKHLIVTNAAGGLNSDFHTGEIMLIRDHINLTGANPLVGPNPENRGERFPDMTCVYDRTLSEIVVEACREMAIGIHQGVYAGLLGPSLETPAEIRFLKTIGADAVGLSTVQEVIAAVHAGMKILGLSTITNVNDPDNPAPANVASIVAAANRATPVIDAIIGKVVDRL